MDLRLVRAETQQQRSGVEVQRSRVIAVAESQRVAHRAAGIREVQHQRPRFDDDPVGTGAADDDDRVLSCVLDGGATERDVTDQNFSEQVDVIIPTAGAHDAAERGADRDAVVTVESLHQCPRAKRVDDVIGRCADQHGPRQVGRAESEVSRAVARVVHQQVVGSVAVEVTGGKRPGGALVTHREIRDHCVKAVGCIEFGQADGGWKIALAPGDTGNVSIPRHSQIGAFAEPDVVNAVAVDITDGDDMITVITAADPVD